MKSLADECAREFKVVKGVFFTPYTNDGETKVNQSGKFVSLVNTERKRLNKEHLLVTWHAKKATAAVEAENKKLGENLLSVLFRIGSFIFRFGLHILIVFSPKQIVCFSTFE